MSVNVGSLHRRQAADMAMESAAYRFAQAQRQQGAIVLASNDQGFAKVLRYCGSLGCAVVVVGAPAASPVQAVAARKAPRLALEGSRAQSQGSPMWWRLGRH